MANENITQLITDEAIIATMDGYLSTQVFDQVALQWGVGRMMMDNPYNVKRNGGRRIKIALRTGKTDGLVAFGDNSTVDPQRKPVLQWAFATFKQCLANVRISWVEERQNTGPDAIISILKSRVDATIQDAREDFRTMIWGDGTGGGGLNMMGITGLIPNDPRTGTIMGYDRSLAASGFWKPWYWDGATYGPLPTDTVGGAPSGVGAFGAINAGTGRGIPTALRILVTGWNSTQEGENAGDCFWLSDQQTYQYYAVDWPVYGSKVEIAVDDKVIKWGYGGATLMGAPWIYDTTVNGAPGGEIRLINKRYLHMVIDSGAWWIWSDWKEPFNQPSRAKFMFVRGQLICKNFRKQAVYPTVTAWA